MQTSGTFPQLSDGTKKVMTAQAVTEAKRVQARVSRMSDLDAKPTHRRGGFQKHAKGGK